MQPPDFRAIARAHWPGSAAAEHAEKALRQAYELGRQSLWLPIEMAGDAEKALKPPEAIMVYGYPVEHDDYRHQKVITLANWSNTNHYDADGHWFSDDYASEIDASHFMFNPEPPKESQNA